MTGAMTQAGAKASDKDEEERIRLLKGLGGAKPPAPQWFEDHIAQTSEEQEIEVAGAPIRYLTWGERGRPGLILVHGGRAHARWWAPLAPFFADQFRIAAFHIGGMGRSGWRESYSLQTMVQELFAVAEAAGLYDVTRPIAVGHSFGGYVVLGAVEEAGERLKGAVIVDSPIMPPDPDEGYHFSRKTPETEPVRPNKVYETEAEALARFRFLPNQPCDNLFLVDYIARTALKRAPLPEAPEKSGWTWAFDPAMGRNFDLHFKRDLFLAARCPLAFIYGGKSAFSSEETFAHLRQQTGGRAPIVMIPNAHHHIMMDEPVGFVSALRSLFSVWPVRVGVV